MNLTEFAEQIVFATTLDEKLALPGNVSDEVRRGPNVDSLATPGRPVGMEMHSVSAGRGDPGENAQPPSDDSLENEAARGRLLHFLANHELLATELMALVLLKFPDAPAEFRQGVFATLQEEQAHTRMYLRRMKECGVEFGSFPLSGQFWRIVEPMKSPLDFVSRLSLTFEQANLDYSLHFAKVFRQIGDDKTAAVLQKIYQDEIGHVQHGLHWFRQWKDPELSDWQAYEASLDFPMSPQRGRGPRGAFNRKGRQLAGLSDDFIDAIEVFRMSRGRAPTVRWFDPGAEAELAGEPSSKERSLLDQLAKDLEWVMIAMARQDDIQLVRRVPSQQFRKQWLEAGFDLPEFVALDARARLADRKLRELSPWAWTPGSLEVAEPMLEAAHHPPPRWRGETEMLFRKSWSAARLREWQRDDPPDWFTSSDCAAIVIDDVAEVPAVLEQFAERGVVHALFKQDLATAGRGQRRLRCDQPLNGDDKAWLRSLREQWPVGIVEPELDRVVDLSFLWHLPAGEREAQYLGWTRPLVTAGRRYAGTRLGNALADCSEQLRRFVLGDRQARMQTVADWLEPRITKELLAHEFEGYFGVDALIAQQADWTFKVKPLVELNPRMTMGHVAQELAKRLAPGVNADFRVLAVSEWRALRSQLERVPLTRSRDGHLNTGALLLGEAGADSRFVPMLLAGDEAIAIASNL